MSKSQIGKSNRIPKSELEELLNDGKESKYWSAKPKPRRYIIENEKTEEYYDNLVLDALKKYDNICGQKFGNKVCFQKHCSHKQEEKKDQKKEDRQEEDYQEDYQGENYHQQEDNYRSNPLKLLIEAIKVVENKKEDEKQQIIKLVDYESTDEEMIESPNTIESESEEELIVGQVPLYLPPANFFPKSIKKD